MDRSMLLGFRCRFHDSFNVNFVNSLVFQLLDIMVLCMEDQLQPTNRPIASSRIPLLIAIFRPTSSNPTLVKIWIALSILLLG